MSDLAEAHSICPDASSPGRHWWRRDLSDEQVVADILAQNDALRLLPFSLTRPQPG
jgi:hypothetical protein